MKQEDLLDKYYRGETSLEEEKTMKEHFLDEEKDSAEKDMFGYFQNESFVPADLEASVFNKLTEHQNKTKIRKIRLYSIISSAAVLAVILSVYLNFQAKEKARIENNFFVMEQALFQVSESIQPVEQEEMLVLWVDDEVEIIIN
jgi:methionine salvage enolase-phosphatase E1